MSDEYLSRRPDGERNTLTGVEQARAPETSVSRPLIRAEANLLRFPLFALHTKGLRSLDGIECTGRMTRGGETYQFTYRATRNTATLYPGPLSRSVHLAFLGMLSEGSTPTLHPLTWSWRDLCRRLDIAPSGRTFGLIKQAITATAGLLIQSDMAFYSKPERKLLRTDEQTLHLYERVVFTGMVLPDGTKAEENCLWLAHWYRENLDAFFTAPLDYPLWKYLESHSPIANRLYEYLLVNFYGPAPLLRINYETLTQFLPIRPEKYLSSAQRQLAGAIRLLRDTQILGNVEWMSSRSGIATLHLFRGQRLTKPSTATALSEAPLGEETPETVRVRELRNLKPPEWHLVAEFNAEWKGSPHLLPTSKELAQAHDLIDRYGITKSRAIVKQAIKHLKERWPEAKTFGAVSHYLAEAIADVERAERRSEREHQEQSAAAEEMRAEQLRKQQATVLGQQWKAEWYRLSGPEQEEIVAAVKLKFPHYVRLPHLFEKRCIHELASRRVGALPPLPAA